MMRITRKNTSAGIMENQWNQHCRERELKLDQVLMRQVRTQTTNHSDLYKRAFVPPMSELRQTGSAKLNTCLCVYVRPNTVKGGRIPIRLSCARASTRYSLWWSIKSREPMTREFVP